MAFHSATVTSAPFVTVTSGANNTTNWTRSSQKFPTLMRFTLLSSTRMMILTTSVPLKQFTLNNKRHNEFIETVLHFDNEQQ